MSIIQDALKKAQQERTKKKKQEIPYHRSDAQKKTKTLIIYIIGSFCVAALFAYLYIPSFHRPKQIKQPVAAQTPGILKPAQVLVSAQPLPKTDKPVNTAQQKKNDAAKDPVSRNVSEKQTTAKTGLTRVQETTPPASQKRIVHTTGTTNAQLVVNEPPKTVENVDKRRNDENVDAAYNEALQEQQSGRLKEAKIIYKQILARQPNHTETLNNLGVIAIREGNTEEALFYFKRILEYQKGYSKAYNNIGLIAMKEGNYELAEEYLRKATSLTPDDPEPYLNLSALLRSRGRLQEAERVLEMLIRKKVKDSNLFLSYAVIKDNLGQHEEAAKYYRQYLSSIQNPASKKEVIERLKYIEMKIMTNNQITITK